MGIVMQFDDGDVMEADMSGFVPEKVLAAARCGYWAGETSGSDGMRFEGLYGDDGPGLLIRISVPGCSQHEANLFQHCRGIFGFTVVSNTIWFALMTQVGGYDAPFRKFSMDMAGRTMITLAREGKLTALKLIFVDGSAVRALRTLKPDHTWFVRLGTQLDKVPFRDDLETVREVEGNVMENVTTEQILALSDAIFY